MKLYVSRKPEKKGGGANSFAWNFVSWAKSKGHTIVSRIQKAERAIIIANIGEIQDLEEAKANGCYIIHRIDEYFEHHESTYRREKHGKIIALNKYADVTVFQSKFVCDNAYPFIRPRHYEIILNGGDSGVFHPTQQPGEFIGHVTWGMDERKRLDLLNQKIVDSPNERFWLVGNHQESEYDFKLPNVVLRGVKDRKQIPKEYQRMKLLFFPSENEPCPNIPIEAILSGVPVCYNNTGGTPEVVQDCGEPLEAFDYLASNLEVYRQRCLERQDLHFERVFREYMSV